MLVEVEKVIDIAILAGTAILNVYNSPSEDFDITAKSDASPLTKADSASNEVICSKLFGLYPNIPIISEENKLIDYSIRKKFEYAWMIDPLDGTKEFIKRNGEFTVNIALLFQGMPVLGVVYVPVSGEIFYAEKGKGAYKRIVGNNDTSKLATKPLDLKQGGLTVVCSRSHMSKETETFLSEFDSPNLVSVGSSLKFMLVAEGKAQLYPRLAPTMEWDTAASQIIVAEAGGKVLNFETKAPMNYNKSNLLNPYFIVYA